MKEMTIMMAFRRSMAIVVLAGSLALTALAQGEFKGMGDGIETCPVTGEKISSKENKAEIFGRAVYFCCGGCMATAKKSPELYVKKTEKEQLAAVAAMAKMAGGAHDDHHHAEPQAAGSFLGKGDGVETCPVTGEPISKSVKAEIGGKTVYFCCEGCIDTVKKNPAAYLKNTGAKTAETAYLGTGDGVSTCPVTGEPISKSVKAEFGGKTVYFCCEGCIDTVKKNPSAYLK